MIGITLTTDQIRTAPADVRHWIEHQVIASLGLSSEAPVAEQPHASHLVACSPGEAAAVLAQVQNLLPAMNVFFEFGRPAPHPAASGRLPYPLHRTSIPARDRCVRR